MKRLSISLDDDSYRLLEQARKLDRIKRSRFIAAALKEYLSRRGMPTLRTRAREYPTVLSKLKLAGGLSLRSPKLAIKRVASDWVIEEY